MLPRKKLAYYAEKYGVRAYAGVRLTVDEIHAISKDVGCSKEYGMEDCGGKLGLLIDRVMDDPAFKERIIAEKFSSKEFPMEFVAIRIPDYAADAVMASYAKIQPSE